MGQIIRHPGMAYFYQVFPGTAEPAFKLGGGGGGKGKERVGTQAVKTRHNIGL